MSECRKYAMNDELRELNYTDDEKIEELFTIMEDEVNDKKSNSYNKKVNVDNDNGDELVPGLKVLKQTDKSYYVKDADGNKFWICKYCFDNYGKLVKLHSGFEVAGHYRKEHPEFSGKSKDDKIEEIFKEETEPGYIPTIEEELTNERAKKLYKLLKDAPGVDKRRIPWICKVFQSTKRLQNPEALHAYLKRQTKMLDEDIRYIVYSVFEEEENDEQSPFYDIKERINEEKIDYSDLKRIEEKNNNFPFNNFSPFHTSSGLGLTIQSIDDLIRLFEFFEKRSSNRNVDPKEIEEKAYMKAKLEFMEKQMQQWEEERKRMFELLKNRKTYSGNIANEWTFMESLIDKVYDAGSGVARELANLNRLILIMMLGKRKGYTDEDILNLVEKEVGKEFIE